MKLLTKYLCVGASYGFIRKSAHVTFQDPQINVTNKYDVNEHKSIVINRSMLVTEKVSTIIAHGTLSSLYWPYFMTKDLVLIEAKIRKINLKPDDDPIYMHLYWHITN